MILQPLAALATRSTCSVDSVSPAASLMTCDMGFLLRKGTGMEHHDELSQLLLAPGQARADLGDGAPEPFLMDLGELPRDAALRLGAEGLLRGRKQIDDAERRLVDDDGPVQGRRFLEIADLPAAGARHEAEEHEGVGGQAG